MLDRGQGGQVPRLCFFPATARVSIDRSIGATRAARKWQALLIDWLIGFLIG